MLRIGCRLVATFAFIALVGREARAGDDSVLTWLAAGASGAQCGTANSSPTCHESLGLDCIQQTCNTSRDTADVSCVAGEADCNACVNDVLGKFDNIFANGEWHTDTWSYNWTQRYAPSNLSPSSAYDDSSTADDFTFQLKHVQGFVRTNDVYLPYAMSHSDDDGQPGSISIVGVVSPFLKLHAIHATDSSHPSGVFTLGKYVGFMDGSSHLRLLDLTRSLESHRIVHQLPREVVPMPPPLEPIIDCWSEGELVAAGVCSTATPIVPVSHSAGTAGGGVAMARLKGGAHLIVAGQGGRQGGNSFLMLEGDIEHPSKISYLGFAAYDGPSDLIGSENLSIITECGTGDVYTVHVDGDDSLDIWPVTAGRGHFRLSKLIWDNATDRPVLAYQSGWTMPQIESSCWLRGAGTIYTHPTGYAIEAYCHSRGEDSTSGDKLDFRSRRMPVPVPDPGPCEPELPSCGH